MVSRQARHQQRYPERTRARAAVSDAIRSGLLAPPSAKSCAICGTPAQHYHHWKGYGQADALDVQPVCTTCHGRMHRVPARVKPVPAPTQPRRRTEELPADAVPAPGIVTLRRAAAVRDIPLRTLQHAAQQRELEVVEFGGVYGTTWAAVEKWLREAPRRRGPKPGGGTARLSTKRQRTTATAEG